MRTTTAPATTPTPAAGSTTTTFYHHPPPPSTTPPPSNTSVCIRSSSRVVAVFHDHDHDDLPPPSNTGRTSGWHWLLFATAHYHLPPPSNASVRIRSFSRVVVATTNTLHPPMRVYAYARFRGWCLIIFLYINK